MSIHRVTASSITYRIRALRRLTFRCGQPPRLGCKWWDYNISSAVGRQKIRHAKGNALFDAKQIRRPGDGVGLRRAQSSRDAGYRRGHQRSPVFTHFTLSTRQIGLRPRVISPETIPAAPVRCIAGLCNPPCPRVYAPLCRSIKRWASGAAMLPVMRPFSKPV